MTDNAKDVPATTGRRTGPVQFFQEVRREASKVTWPTWKETWITTVMVFVMVALLMVFFFFVDWGLSAALKMMLGV